MTAALTVTNMSKSFSGPRVLDSVSLSLEPGEIRALVGENGSGKSTLIKILAGFHVPDEGSAEVAGESLQLGHGEASEAVGLRFVHQDLGLVNNLDAVDNIALGAGYPSFHGRIRWRQERKRTRAALAELGYEFDVRQHGRQPGHERAHGTRGGPRAGAPAEPGQGAHPGRADGQPARGGG